MTDITDKDAALWRVELPQPALLKFSSSVFADGHGVIEYRSQGLLKAPAVVMLHGLGSSSAGYRAQLASLPPGFRAIAWNAPGFGRSACLSAAEPKAADYAQALKDFVTALGLQRIAVLVGSSWGSVIAASFADATPDRLDALMLAAPNLARGRLTGSERDVALTALLGAGETQEERAAVARRLLADDAPTEVRALVEWLRDAVTPAGWRQAVHMLFSIPTPDALQRWHGPAMVVAGTQDTVAPIDVHAAAVARAMPQAQLHRLQGCGHMPKLEAPQHFNALIRALAGQAHLST